MIILREPLYAAIACVRAVKCDPCARTVSAYLKFMPPAIAATRWRSRVRRGKSAHRLPSAEIQARLEEIELATVSSLRALQMDVEGDAGVPSSEVLKKARLALR